METPATYPTLQTYLTWALGIDGPGQAIIYAASPDEAFALLDQCVQRAQPRPQLFTQGLHYGLLHARPGCVSSRAVGAQHYGQHVYHIGSTTDEPRARVLVLEDGYDAQFDD